MLSRELNGKKIIGEKFKKINIALYRLGQPVIIESRDRKLPSKRMKMINGAVNILIVCYKTPFLSFTTFTIYLVLFLISQNLAKLLKAYSLKVKKMLFGYIQKRVIHRSF